MAKFNALVNTLFPVNNSHKCKLEVNMQCYITIYKEKMQTKEVEDQGSNHQV